MPIVGEASDPACIMWIFLNDYLTLLWHVAILKLHCVDLTDDRANPNAYNSKHNFIAYRIPTKGMEFTGRRNST